MTRAGTVFPGILAAALFSAPAPVWSHPHIFIDAGLTVFFDDDGAVAAVEVVWAYDSLYSLLILEDRGLDPDFDGVLTPEETDALRGFDMNWVEGFQGDSFATFGDTELGLERPRTWDAGVADGRIVTTHLRPLDTPVVPGEAPLIVALYDPTYYTAYEINLPVRMENAPPGCRADVYAPDLDSATEQLQAALQEFTGSVDPFLEADFPAVGSLFAEEVRVTCGE